MFFSTFFLCYNGETRKEDQNGNIIVDFRSIGDAGNIGYIWASVECTIANPIRSRGTCVDRHIGLHHYKSLSKAEEIMNRSWSKWLAPNIFFHTFNER